MKSLETLNLQRCNLSGPIPSELGNLNKLNDLTLHLHTNKLSGSIPKELAYLDNLRVLTMTQNQLSGHLPDQLCQGGKLENFTVASNKLTGPIPRSLSNCSSFKWVRFNNNSFIGNLSEAFGIYPELQFIDLRDNNFHEIGNVQGLLGLDLSSNHLLGQIPKEFGRLTSLVRLSVQNNNIFGNISEELGSLTKLESLDLSDNRLNGSIPTWIGDFVRLFQLNLSNNKFGQKIPKEIGRITHLTVLDLSHNLLDGEIPAELASVLDLLNLNLSHNGLSGRIRKELESLTGLLDVVLSYNDLEGPIPNNKVFMNASLEALNSKGSKLILITVLPVMGALVLLCVFIGVLFMCNKRRRVKDVERRDGDGWLSISMIDGKALYRDILNATEEFDAKFCIGQGGHGSVYKVNLPLLGDIAVKRLHSSFQNTHPKSFINEVRALTGIKHRNIVNLYDYCSKAQHSLLVYEYVERGSLSSILSNEVESKKLDWLKRVNIIKGVAFALSYMHQDCSPPIVYRDISSSNVLVDSEYEARVTPQRIFRTKTRAVLHVE
ncbi:hypothetical protein KY290_022294 [Solanum tuberosum]|uniref:non-specific serine/threonine protein kinase n=1 Tax=Solanum tuberosum TaxID=4113 RepID=A0ABQ7V400_SOLTU|nr:hypothetical protein KY289_021423 [Solanum tuberosum]KAH0758801.1 hypothetical protein KY290_022294 [Solanum tuberosum]